MVGGDQISCHQWNSAYYVSSSLVCDTAWVDMYPCLYIDKERKKMREK